jgi:uncharacterized membrane protein YccC
MTKPGENPFESPRGVQEDGGGAPFPVLRLTISGILVGVGCLLLLLLNGQHFSNRVGFLLLVIFSAVLWVLPAANKVDESRTLSLGIFLMHLAIVVATMWSLPGAYEAQRQFNDAVRKVRSGPLPLDHSDR